MPLTVIYITPAGPWAGRHDLLIAMRNRHVSIINRIIYSGVPVAPEDPRPG